MPLRGQKLVTAVEAIQALIYAKKHNQMEVFRPYEWQEDFYAAGKTNKQRQILAGNRVGKSAGAAYEIALHLTGRYPDWWQGHRFTRETTIWCVGTTGEQIRDVIQFILFGRLHPPFDGGMVPADLITKIVRAIGTPFLAKDVHVRHVSGNNSVCSLKSYTQNVSALMGASIDVGWIDEQPGSVEYGQVLTRTMTGDQGRGGLLIVTATPELGMNDVLQQWFDDIQPGQWMRTVTWNDSPHLTEEVKDQMRAAIPPYQRKMREFGVPLMGAGLVFAVSEERYTIDPPVIKDWWRVAVGIDFGFGHDFAAIWCALDPESDVLYVYDEYLESGQVPAVHTAAIRARGPFIPIAWPHDGDNTEKGSGEKLADLYRKAGANMTAKFSNLGAGDRNFVEPGILELNERLQTQRLFISSKCQKLLGQMRVYHRDEHGKIVKKNDDAVDAMRYGALMTGRIGRPYTERNQGRPKVNMKRKRMEF